MAVRTYKLIDLYAGIGSIRKGLEMTTRFKSILSVEPDPYANLVYQYLYKEQVYSTVHSSDFRKQLDAMNYDVLITGWPSNYYFRSDAKVTKKNRPGANACFETLEVLKRVRPVAFMIVSVDTILDYDRGRTFSSLIKTLDSYSYHIVGVNINNGKVSYAPKDIVRNFGNFGLPQNKKCVIIMGFKKRGIKKNYQFPPLPQNKTKEIYPDINSFLDGGVAPKYYVSEALLTSVRKRNDSSSLERTLIINEGNMKWINPLMSVGVYGREHNLVRQPSPSYVGLLIGNKPAINKEGIRFLTPNEWGKLHGFVNYAFLKDGIDRFAFPSGISDKQKYRLFGNSFSIPMMETMGDYMALRLDDFY